MAHIKRPLTNDGLVGYDSCGNFIATKREGDRETSWGIADVRGMICSICNHGWEPTGPSMADQFRWDLVEGYAHESCFSRFCGLNERREFYGALVSAGVRFRGLRPIENEYWPPSYESAKKPWYTAELIDHPAMFKLGARKRVDHVEVIAQGGTTFVWAGDAEKAFAAENVTKHFTPTSVLLHAYTLEKMREYVRQLVQIAGYAVERG